MNPEDSSPTPQTAGAIPPPRPPRRSGKAASAGGDDSRGRKTIRISLPPKPTATVAIKAG